MYDHTKSVLESILAILETLFLFWTQRSLLEEELESPKQAAEHD
jgi:hypothetical protein